MAVPYTFGSATSSIPLSQLDSNFATGITLGNTTVYLGNTTTSFGNVTLTNVTISSVSTAITPSQGGTGLVTIPANNVILGNGTSNVTVVAPGTSGNVLTSNGTTWSSSTISAASVSAAGSTTQVQYNNGGAFAGSANLTFNGTTLTAAGLSGPHDGTVGATTPNTGSFTTLAASSTVSGTGFSTYLASPPAIGGTAPNTGNFTTLTTSSTVTLNGGTANGVTYLNGSKVLTSGSALTFDGTNFKTTGSVLAGGSAPSSGAGVTLTYNGTTGNIYSYDWGTSTYKAIGLNGNSVDISAAGNTQTTFGVNGSEQMRLNSTGLGIGTSSPQKKLVVSNAGAAGMEWSPTDYTGNMRQLAYNRSTSAYVALRTEASQHEWYIGGSESMRLDSAGNLGIGTSSPSAKLDVNGTIYSRTGGVYTDTLTAYSGSSISVNAGSSYFAVTVNSAERLRVDSAGNLGLGVTPSAWGIGKVLQVNNASLMGYLNRLYANANTYFDGTGTGKYIASDYATSYQQVNGIHQWFNAPSGTAGTNISFTQAMTLDASGNLLIGTTTPSANSKLTVSGAGITITGGRGSTYALNWADWLVYNSSSGNALVFDNGSERARIDSSGNLLVGTTSSGAGLGYATRIAVDGGASEVSVFKTSAGTGAYCSRMWNSATSGNNLFVNFQTEAGGTDRGSITYNRVAGLTAYNTTSDYRAKDISGPVIGSGALIDSVPVYMGKMKGATQERPMFIAHETPAYAHTGEKDAVDADGNPVYQQMDASALIPVMWAEIQSLRQRVAQLETN